jgi:uncharacterized protein (TIGR03083 family)
VTSTGDGPGWAELVAAVRREGAGVVAAIPLDPSAAVPHCPGWDLRELGRHLTEIYRYVTEIVTTRATSSPDDPVVDDEDVPAALDAALDDLVEALTEAGPDTPMWNWTVRQPHDAAFWARRMAHESAVHRVDAQQALGVSEPIDDDLARDGIDELVAVFGPRVFRRDRVAGPSGMIALRCPDGGWTWLLESSDEELRYAADDAAPDVTVTGNASQLLLAAYGRAPWSTLDLDGDAALLDRWAAAMCP